VRASKLKKRGDKKNNSKTSGMMRGGALPVKDLAVFLQPGRVQERKFTYN